MDSVIGLDVAKGKSVIQVFLKRNDANGNRKLLDIPKRDSGVLAKSFKSFENEQEKNSLSS